MRPTAFLLLLMISIGAATPMSALAQRRMVLIDQDGSGPGGSNMMAMMVLLQAPQVDVLGITIVTGNDWRDDEARHTLRMLELIGRKDVPVALGAVFPLIRTQEETRLNVPLAGQVAWLGAWGHRTVDVPAPKAALRGPWDTPPLEEGEPQIKPTSEDAAHFLIRQVHAHPHQVTVYAAGPLTDIAVALAIDPHTRRPRLGNGFGGLSGPAIKPIALRMVYDAAHAVKIPVIGMGGITTPVDVVEFMLAGASAVQVGTASYFDPVATEALVGDLTEYCRQHRIERLSELTGGMLTD